MSDEVMSDKESWAPVVGKYAPRLPDATEEDITEVVHAVEEGSYIGPEQGGLTWLPADCYVAPDSSQSTVHSVTSEVGEVLQLQAKRIADLEAMLEAQRTLTANATAEVERQQAIERSRRIDAEQAVRAGRWAIDALIEALVPFARFAAEEDGQVRGMTEPVCLSMAAVHRADALVKLHKALR